MVKDNKFAAEPSADSTADSKVSQSKTATTTENFLQPREEVKEAKEDLKKANGSKEDKIYSAYVRGDSINSISDAEKMQALEVLKVVQKIERNR